ncbi:MAG: hypothetical protein EOP42_21120 [Sphingobacteriaceae bacterium]|nr:MAG: hypothetical protein EOP42_21120 [Sphingobacteriaceae bacterium]
MIKIAFSILLCLLFCGFAKATEVHLNQFILKENPFAKDEVAVVACDSTGTPQENINGLFNFTINGFKEELQFEKGVAFYRHKLEKSSFLYLKHRDDLSSQARLFYIYKHDSKLDPYKINWKLLVAIPLILVFLGYLFKRFIIIAFIVFCLFSYFNYHGGMSLGTFFETIFDGLKNVF